MINNESNALYYVIYYNKYPLPVFYENEAQWMHHHHSRSTSACESQQGVSCGS